MRDLLIYVYYFSCFSKEEGGAVSGEKGKLINLHFQGIKGKSRDVREKDLVSTIYVFIILFVTVVTCKIKYQYIPIKTNCTEGNKAKREAIQSSHSQTLEINHC